MAEPRSFQQMTGIEEFEKRCQNAQNTVTVDNDSRGEGKEEDSKNNASKKIETPANTSKNILNAINQIADIKS